MGVNTLSLRARSILIAIGGLVLFTPAAVLTVDEAYKASLTQATHQQLKLNALMLISEFEFVDDLPQMPLQVFDEQLNLADSGVYGYIRWRDEVVWQSSSSFTMTLPNLPIPPATGAEAFVEQNGKFIYTFTAEFQTTFGFSPVHFFVVYDKASFEQERRSFLRTLWQGLLILAGVLLISLFFGIRFLLKPLNRLRREIGQATSGKQTFVASDYPKEISPLTNSINQLISTEKQQRERYKNSLSDLAHSLKTPLTVAIGEARSQTPLLQPLQEIENIIQRQLKRTAAQKPGWYNPIAVKPIVDKLIAAMEKVHAERELTILNDMGDEIELSVESTDLMECIGNVLDNACKAANSRVQISHSHMGKSTDIVIDDDGPGIKKAHQTMLLTRGQRLDTYQEGQGIGMAVVSDIMSSYGGSLAIDTSPLGGARIRLCFAPFTG